jgi:hypothetical protein
MATVQDIRYEIGDTDGNFPILADDEINYYLTKNSDTLSQTCIDCARAILMKLSLRAEDTTVDIFSVKGSKAAESYRQALVLYISNPMLNPVLKNAQGWFGGVSVSQMQNNDSNLDNNIVKQPSVSYAVPTGWFTFG